MIRDQAQRDRIRTDLHSGLFVEAGAGTGKTRSLVERIVGLMRERQIPPRRIIAITFTIKAAAELRERVRAALIREGELSAADELASAPFGTIDAFVRRLIDEHPLESGLAPGWQAISDQDAAEELNRAWPTIRRQALARPEADRAWRLLHASEIGWEKLRRFASESKGPPAEAAGTGDLLAEIAEVAALGAGKPTTDTLAARLNEIADALAGPMPLANMPSLRVKNLGKKDVWGDLKAQIGARLADCNERLGEALYAEARTALAVLAELAGEVAERRRAQGRITFDEAKHAALRMLQDNPSVLAEVRAAYDAVLIDEFQDTDPAQFGIARLIAGGDASRLFVVGDPKQSIYAFRGSDIATYFAARDEGWGAHVTLSENFRTTEPVLSWVNTCFAAVFAGEQRFACEPLGAAGEGARDAPGLVRFLGGASEMPLDELRAQQAQDIASACGGLLAEGVETRSGKLRLGDIAVIAPKRKVLLALESALEEAGLPFVVESEKELFETQDGRTYLAMVRSLVDSSDRVATIAFSRSPFVGYSDAELYRMGRDPEELERWRKRMREAGLCETVHELYRELRIEEVAELGPRPAETVSVWRALMQHAREHRDLSPVAYLQRCQEDRKVGLRTELRSEPDPDRVRLMTVHAAKGLEFPVVIVAGLETAATGSPPTVLGDQVKLGEIRSGGWDMAYSAYQQGQADEMRRVLYVAATRARPSDHLSSPSQERTGAGACGGDGRGTRSLATDGNCAKPSRKTCGARTKSRCSGHPGTSQAGRGHHGRARG